MNQKLRMRPTAVAFALAALFAGNASAQTPAPAPDFTFTGNVGLYSQSVFRGISQTNEKHALQGGFDLTHKSGFYHGTWASNVGWIEDFQGNRAAEFTALVRAEIAHWKDVVARGNIKQE